MGLQAPSQGVLSVTRDGGGLRVGDVLRACSSYTRDALTTAAKEANGAIAHKSATAHKAATAAVGHGSFKSPKVVFENLLHSLLALASPPSKCLFVTDGHAPEEVGVSCPACYCQVILQDTPRSYPLSLYSYSAHIRKFKLRDRKLRDRKLRDRKLRDRKSVPVCIRSHCALGALPLAGDGGTHREHLRAHRRCTLSLRATSRRGGSSLNF